METSRLIEEDGVLIDCLAQRDSWLSLNVVVVTFVISQWWPDWTLYRIQVVAGVVGHNTTKERSQAATTQLLLPAFPAITAYKYNS